MKTHIIKWKSLDSMTPVDKVREFTDVQWKEYGVRATDDQNMGYTLIIPYTSIYDIEVKGDDFSL